ncbi:MAG: hypothetical protein IH827_07410 [Myxococcales bacterium]|nr:hypothetical protein [Myxococcales bacterium]
MPTQIVDFEAVKRNAEADGIPLSEIAIKYENLTVDELGELESHQEVTTDEPGGGSVLAKFPESGEPLFQHKATAVLFLGA